MDITGHTRKYTFHFGEKKIIFAKLGHETEFHVYAKALVFALFHKEFPTLRVEPKLDERFQPDLSAVSYDGTTVLWAECGKVSLNKIEKLFKKYRQARFIFVKEERDIPLFKNQLNKLAKDMTARPMVDIIVYPEHMKEWWVSEEGDVFVPKDDVTIIRWEYA